MSYNYSDEFDMKDIIYDLDIEETEYDNHTSVNQWLNNVADEHLKMIFEIAVTVPSVLIYYIIFFIFEIDMLDIIATLVILGIPMAVTKLWLFIIDLIENSR